MPEKILSDSYCSPGLIEELTEEVEQLVSSKPEDPDIHLTLANCYFNLGRFEKALDAYKKVVELDQEKIQARVNMGHTYKLMNEITKAKNLYEELLSQGKEFPDVHKNLGDIYYQLGETGEAIKQYEAAINRNPRYQDALFALGRLYEDVEEYSKAMRYFRSVAEYFMKNRKEELFLSSVTYDLALIYQNHELAREAIRHLKKVTIFFPDHADAYFQLGKLYKSLGKIDEAIDAFERALKINPSYRAVQEEYWDCLNSGT